MNGTSNGVNGANGINGVNGTTGPKKVGSGLETHHEAPLTQPNHAASRAEVESSFTAFAQLIHAAQRPLPNQTGDGTYIEEKQQHSGLWADLRSLGFKDAKTLTEVMKNTATGALVDDRGMLMERVIQVSWMIPHRCSLTNLINLNSLSLLYLLARRLVPTSPMRSSINCGATLTTHLSHTWGKGFNIEQQMAVGKFCPHHIPDQAFNFEGITSCFPKWGQQIHLMLGVYGHLQFSLELFQILEWFSIVSLPAVNTHHIRIMSQVFSSIGLPSSSTVCFVTLFLAR